VQAVAKLQIMLLLMQEGGAKKKQLHNARYFLMEMIEEIYGEGLRQTPLILTLG
jgi:hypothetical protein